MTTKPKAKLLQRLKMYSLAGEKCQAKIDFNFIVYVSKDFQKSLEKDRNHIKIDVLVRLISDPRNSVH